jgi:hypothetical protein
VSDRIEAFMQDDGGDEGEAVQSDTKGSDRIKSLMDMDYEPVESESKEPEDDGIEDGPIIPKNIGAKPKAERKDAPAAKEEDEEVEEEKKEKEEVKEEEEKKPEAGKHKVKYKVDGQEVEEELSDEEIAAAVSGRKAIQKRFTEIDQQKKQVAKEKEEVDHTVNYVKSEMKGIRDSFETAIEEFSRTGVNKSNPVESVYNLLDKMGLDTASFEKAVFFHHLPETAKFLDMSDAERDAYLLAHENKWLKKHRSAVELEKKGAAEYKAKLQQENSAKHQAGVSEEEYEELKGELAGHLGREDLKLEEVLAWKREKPALTRAESIAQKVKGVDVIKLAKLFLEFPETTDEWIMNELGYKDQQAKEISEKLKSKAPPKLTKRTQEDTDEDIEFFKNNFRRG